MRGRDFDLVDRRVAWGESRVNFYDDEGRLRRVPTRWTDLDPPDLFVVRAAGRCPFRADDLARLALLVSHLKEERSVKGTSPHV